MGWNAGNAGGWTPLIRIEPEVLVKCEFLHPGRSHKARVARALIDDAERRHGLTPDDGRVLLERTGGNLGVALAMEARARGYPLTLVTDPQYSSAKRRLAAALGATVIDRDITFPEARNNGEAISMLLAGDDGSRYQYLNQFGNEANPRAHEQSTGPEIRSGLVARGVPRETTIILVTGMGTGASMRGISTALRTWYSRVVTVAVQPPNCDLCSGVYGEHEAQGIAVGEPAPFMPVTEVDAVVAVSGAEIAIAHDELMRRCLLVGPSSAANIAAVRLARRHRACQALRRVFVTLLFDRGEDYL